MPFWFLGCCSSAQQSPSDGGGDPGPSSGSYSAFNTGVSVVDGLDQAWTLDHSDAAVVPPAKLLFWQTPFAGSKWIAMNNDMTSDENTLHSYSTTLSVSSTDGLSIRASVLADNTISDILVNGVSTGLNGSDFVTPATFELPVELFTEGSNTVEFVVSDIGGWTGFCCKWL